MKVVHVTEYCHLQTIGGTERYILDLVTGLQPLGWESVILWLNQNDTVVIDSNGIQIREIPRGAMRVDVAPPRTAERTRFFMKQEAPDLVCFHTFGCTEAECAAMVEKLGIPYIFIYHSPAWGCRRDDLLQWGKLRCDGRIEGRRCAACILEKHLGCGKTVAMVLERLLACMGFISRWLPNTVWRRRLSGTRDTVRFRNAFRQFLQSATNVVICCDWGMEVMLLNGVTREQIRKVPQGVGREFLDFLQKHDSLEKASVRMPKVIGYVGRVTPTKGVHLLIQAFLQAPDLKAELRLIGLSAKNCQNSYEKKMLKMAGPDHRIKFIEKVGLKEMVSLLDEVDILTIPSIWPETGPLTLFEGAAAGCMLLGSQNVGQLEFLKKFGKIVPEDTADAWERALRAALATPFRRERKAGIRTMAETAAENAAVFSDAAKRVPRG